MADFLGRGINNIMTWLKRNQTPADVKTILVNAFHAVTPMTQPDEIRTDALPLDAECNRARVPNMHEGYIARRKNDVWEISKWEDVYVYAMGLGGTTFRREGAVKCADDFASAHAFLKTKETDARQARSDIPFNTVRPWNHWSRIPA